MYLHYFYAIFLTILLNINILGMESVNPNISKTKNENAVESDLITGEDDSEHSIRIKERFKRIDKKASEDGWSYLVPMPVPAVLKNLKNNNFIRTRDIYNVPGANGKIVFFVIHGTSLVLDFSKEAGPHNNEYNNVPNKDIPTYKRLMKFAASYGKKNKKNVEIVSFRWTGGNQHIDRVDAALFWLFYILANYPNDEIGIISHSHGCNVANILTQIINRPIALLVYFACPIREAGQNINKNPISNDEQSPLHPFYEVLKDSNTDYTPKNFHTLIQFFSTSDWTATLGSLSGGEVAAEASMPFIVYYGLDAAKDLAVELALDYVPQVRAVKFLVDHKEVVIKIFRWGQRAATVGAAFNSLSHLNERAANANVFKLQPNRKIVCLRVQKDAEGTRHDKVPQVASILTEIIELLETDYSAHSDLNSRFDVNFDGEMDEHHKSSLCLAIRKCEQVDTLLQSPVPKDPHLRALRHKLQQEMLLSMQHKEKFKAKHKKDIEGWETDRCNVM